MAPLPILSVSELVDRLNADPGFSDAYTATPGPHTYADGTTAIANLIISAKEPGRGEVSVSGIPNNASKLQKDPGRNEVPAVPEIPGRVRGYSADDILGTIDLTREAGSSTTTVTWPPREPSTHHGFGNANEVPDAGSPGGSYTTTKTWESGAYEAIGQIDRAIEIVSRGRAEMGATENALDHTIRAVGVSAENLALSESRIRDADMAKEITDLKRWEILIQASTQMLAQANTVPQTVLKLLQ